MSRGLSSAVACRDTAGGIFARLRLPSGGDFGRIAGAMHYASIVDPAENWFSERTQAEEADAGYQENLAWMYHVSPLPAPYSPHTKDDVNY